jgi:hypothetical protein
MGNAEGDKKKIADWRIKTVASCLFFVLTRQQGTGNMLFSFLISRKISPACSGRWPKGR